MTKKEDTLVSQSWSKVILPLLLLAANGSVAAYFVPLLPNSSDAIFNRMTAVGFHQLAMIVLVASASVIYLGYYRAWSYFSTRWLIAAVTYNFLLISIKFVLSYQQFSGRRDNFMTLLMSALLVSGLYVGGLLILYLIFDGKLLNKKAHKQLILSRDKKALLAVGMLLGVTVVRIILSHLPGVSGSVATTYLGDVFRSNTMVLNGLLFVMIFAVVEAFAQVRRKSDLKYFFVSASLLVVAVHLWWAIFMFRSYL